MKKIIGLLIALIFFISAAEAVNVQFYINEAAVGKKMLEERVNVHIVKVSDPSWWRSVPYDRRDATIGTERITTWGPARIDLDSDTDYRVTAFTTSGRYTDRSKTVRYSSGISTVTENVYVGLRDCTYITLLVVDDVTGAGISGADVTIGSGAGALRFKTEGSHGMMAGLDLTTNGQIQAAYVPRGSTVPYSITASGYRIASGSVTASASEVPSEMQTIRLTRAATPRALPRPSVKPTPRTPSLPR